MATFEKFHVLDSTGLGTFASALFAIIEATYVRRTTYESDISTLTGRIDELDAFNTYNCEVDPDTGNLIFTIPDGENVSLTIDNSGDLILNSNDSTIDKALQHYSFSINSNGVLYLTIATTV